MIESCPAFQRFVGEAVERCVGVIVLRVANPPVCAMGVFVVARGKILFVNYRGDVYIMR